MHYLLPSLLILLLSTCVRAQENVAYAATVTVGETPDHDVSPLLYGQFIEHLGRCVDGGIYDPGNPLSDERGFRRDVLQLVGNLDVPLLRFPGGTVTKIYHWKDGIGPVADRPKRPNLIWGGNLQHGFGTAEFIAYCRELGAEPMLVVNMGTGTPEEASEWVEYCNGTGDTYWANLRRAHGHPEPFNVKYWGIGNEESAEADAGRHMDPDRYVYDTWQFAKLMKLQDPTLRLTIVGDTRDQAWNHRVLDELHPVTDNFAVHFYAVPNDTTYAAFLRSVYQYDAYLDTFRTQLSALPATGGLSRWYRFPGRRAPVKLAIDEWGIWDMNSPKGRGTYNLEYPFNWGHALGTAAFLHLFHRNNDIIELATWAQTVNVLAPIMTSPDSAWTQTVYTPLAAYRKEMMGRNVPVRVTAPATDGAPVALDVIASLSADETTLTVALLNLDPKRAASVNLEVPAGWKGVEVQSYAGGVYGSEVNRPVGVRAGGARGVGALAPASITFYRMKR